MADLELYGARTLAAAAAVLFVGAGCSSSHDAGATADSAAPGEAGGAATCNSEGRPVDTFSVGMKKAGTSGHFTFQIVSADPAPPNAPQTNTWVIKALDTSGNPLTDAVITLPRTDPSDGWRFEGNPFMPPPMNHPSSVLNQITSQGDGTARVGIYFSMSGFWQIFVYAQSGQTTDSVTFSFCLP